MTVRAKFRVVETRQYPGWSSNLTHGVKLQAVAGGDDSPENKAFFAATPSGEVNISIVGGETAAFFELGKAYYLDFTPAEASVP